MWAKHLESILKSQLESRILSLCEEHIGPLGFRAVDVDCRVASRSLVRIFIERVGESSEKGTSIEDCATVSRTMGNIFDKDNLLPGIYDLEVSSPGLDRRLRTLTDFEKSVGEEIKLKLTEKIEGLGANVTGKLERLAGNALVVNALKKEWPIPLLKIKQANVVWRFQS